MSENVHTVTDLPKHPTLLKWGKRVGIAATAAAVVYATFLIVKSDESDETENTDD